jgi:hypothetical protein
MSNKSIYERDFVVWAEKQAQLLEQHRWEELDLENLVEEIRDLGKRERDKLLSSLRLILQHLLKWQYQSEKRSKSWKNTITRERDNVADYLEDTPSLKKVLQDPEAISTCYRRARRDAARETGLDTLPEQNPYALEQVLDEKFLP